MKTNLFSGNKGQKSGLATLSCEQLEARKVASAARVKSAQEQYNTARFALSTALKPYGVSPDSEDVLTAFTLKLAQAKNNVTAVEGNLTAFMQSPTMLAALDTVENGETETVRAQAQAVVVSKAEDAKTLIQAVDQKRAAFAAAKEVAAALPSLLGRVNNAKTALVSAQAAHKINKATLDKATKVAEAKALLAAPSEPRVSESMDLLKNLLGLA